MYLVTFHHCSLSCLTLQASWTGFWICEASVKRSGFRCHMRPFGGLGQRPSSNIKWSREVVLRWDSQAGSSGLTVYMPGSSLKAWPVETPGSRLVKWRRGERAKTSSQLRDKASWGPDHKLHRQLAKLAGSIISAAKKPNMLTLANAEWASLF